MAILVIIPRLLYTCCDTLCFQPPSFTINDECASSRELAGRRHLTLSLGLAANPRNSRSHRLISFRTIFAFATIGLYLFALSYVPLPSSLKPSGTFSTYLSRLIVIGTIILGFLSGFGAISSSWRFLPSSEPQYFLCTSSRL